MTTEEQKAKSRARVKEWYNRNRERKLAYNRAWKKANLDKDQVREYNKQYYQAHKKELQARHLQWYYNNREKFLAYAKTWYANNRDRKIKSMNEYKTRTDYNRQYYIKRKLQKKENENV